MSRPIMYIILIHKLLLSPISSELTTNNLTRAAKRDVNSVENDRKNYW